MNENSGTEQTCTGNSHAGKPSIMNETGNIFPYEAKKYSFRVYNPSLFTEVSYQVQDRVLLCASAFTFLHTVFRITRDE